MVSRHVLVCLVALGLLAAGCASAAIETRVDEVMAGLRATPDGASEAPATSPLRRAVARPVPDLYFSPLTPEARAAADEVPSGEAPPAAAESPEGATLRGDTLGDLPMKRIIIRDLKAAPDKLWSGTKHSFADPTNLLILGTAFGIDRIVHHNWDSDVRDFFRDDDSSLAETDDFGTVIGNPALHFGIASAWYLSAVHRRDGGEYEKAKVLIEALAVNGIATQLLKFGMDTESPNDQEWGWPSGHTSSSVTFASVIHEYYGLGPAVPLYLLAGYTAATRLEDREHDLSDLVFGAALGWVVGHSVAAGELPEVAGFHVLPWGGGDKAGVMFVKRF